MRTEQKVFDYLIPTEANLEASNIQVLIVDDDLIIQLLHKRLVQKEGLHVSPEACDNGESALKLMDSKCTEDAICVVLLDINMPVMNGWEFLEKIHQNEEFSRKIIVVMVTSSVDPVDKIKAQNYQNVVGFVEKPLNPSSIKQIKEIPQVASLFK